MLRTFAIVSLLSVFGCSVEDAPKQKHDANKPVEGGTKPETPAPVLSANELELKCSGLNGLESGTDPKMLGPDGKTCVDLTPEVKQLQGSYRAAFPHSMRDLLITGNVVMATWDQREEDDAILVSARLGTVSAKDGVLTFHFWKSSCREKAFDYAQPYEIEEDPEGRLAKKILTLGRVGYFDFNKAPAKTIRTGCFADENESSAFTEAPLEVLQ